MGVPDDLGRAGIPFWFDPWNVFDALLVLFSLFDDARMPAQAKHTECSCFLEEVMRLLRAKDFVLAFLLSENSQSQNLKVIFRPAGRQPVVGLCGMLQILTSLNPENRPDDTVCAGPTAAQTVQGPLVPCRGYLGCSDQSTPWKTASS